MPEYNFHIIYQAEGPDQPAPLGPRDEDRYPLHAAVLSNDTQRMIRTLNENLVDVNLLDDRRYTALGLAAQCGHIDMVQLLLAVEGIDVNLEGCSVHSYNIYDEVIVTDVHGVVERITYNVDGLPRGESRRQISPIAVAVEECHCDVLAVLLEDERVDVNLIQPKPCPFVDGIRGTRRLQNGDDTPENRLLSGSSIFDWVHPWAERGDVDYDVYKLLLSCERIDPTTWFRPFNCVLSSENIDLVDLFLRNPRFDLSKQHEECSDLHPLHSAWRWDEPEGMNAFERILKHEGSRVHSRFLTARAVACGHGIPIEVTSAYLFPCFGQTLVTQYAIDHCMAQCSMMKKFVEQYGCVDSFNWREREASGTCQNNLIQSKQFKFIARTI